MCRPERKGWRTTRSGGPQGRTPEVPPDNSGSSRGFVGTEILPLRDRCPGGHTPAAPEFPKLLYQVVRRPGPELPRGWRAISGVPTPRCPLQSRGPELPSSESRTSGPLEAGLLSTQSGLENTCVHSEERAGNRACMSARRTGKPRVCAELCARLPPVVSRETTRAPSHLCTPEEWAWRLYVHRSPQVLATVGCGIWDGE